jgi:hypothetical protein
MGTEKRTVEFRFIVIVAVDLTDLELIETIAESGKRVADIVTTEILSNLESISYVAAVVASEL